MCRHDSIFVLLINRKRLFSLTNDLPTVFEVITGRKPSKDKPSADSGSKSRNNAKVILFCIFDMKEVFGFLDDLSLFAKFGLIDSPLLCRDQLMDL